MSTMAESDRPMAPRRTPLRHNVDQPPVDLPEGVSHASITAYNKYRCRCSECRRYYNDYNKLRRHGRSPRKMVSTSEIRELMLDAMFRGWSQAMLCRMLHMDKNTLSAIVHEKQLTVMPRTAARITPILRMLGDPQERLKTVSRGVKAGSTRSKRQSMELTSGELQY